MFYFIGVPKTIRFQLYEQSYLINPIPYGSQLHLIPYDWLRLKLWIYYEIGLKLQKTLNSSK